MISLGTVVNRLIAATQPRCAADAAGAAVTWARFTRQTAGGLRSRWALAFLQQRLGAPGDKAIYGAPPRSLLALVSLAVSAASHACQRRS